MDLGPAWIHYGTANPLTYLAEKQNCSLRRTQNLNMEVYHNGSAVPRSVVLEMFRLLDQIEDGYNQWKDANPPDASLLMVFQQIFKDRHFHLNPQQQAAFAAILFGEVVEDWTAPLHELSAAKHCEYDNVDGVGSDWRIVEGMQCLLDALSPSSSVEDDLHLKHSVSSVKVDPSSGRVHVLGEQDGLQSTISARTAVLAIPLGELREGRLEIEPLPAWKKNAWQELGLGKAIRAALEFESAFWPTDVEFFMDFMSNCTSLRQAADFLEHVDLCSIEFTAPLNSKRTPVLVAEADGRLAEELLKRSDQAVVDFLLSRLQEMFGVQQVLPLKKASVLRPWGLPFWQKNNPKGRTSARLAGKPLKNRIFFAGDYVSHNVGTVAAAYLSGIAAAHAVLCELGRPGLRLDFHPEIRPMIRPKCAEEMLKGQKYCSLSLWDLLYTCSSLADLEDESGRTCFVQGHDQWHSDWFSRLSQRLHSKLRLAVDGVRNHISPHAARSAGNEL